LKDIIQPPFPKMILFIEFDDNSDRAQKKAGKKAQKILKSHNIKYRLETEEEKREELWRIRHSVATLIAHSEGSKKAIPIVEDGIVPLDQFQNYLGAINVLFKKHGLN